MGTPGRGTLLERGSIGGHGSTPQGEGVEGGGWGQNRFSKNLILSVSRRNFFPEFQGGPPRVQKGWCKFASNVFFLLLCFAPTLCAFVGVWGGGSSP